ncbi:hypothetical protein ABTD08_20265, partial [Acinetobacter baumannii]
AARGCFMIPEPYKIPSIAQKATSSNAYTTRLLLPDFCTMKEKTSDDFLHSIMRYQQAFSDYRKGAVTGSQ